MNPINVSGRALNWCYTICGAVCLGGVATCWGACALDGPSPLADAAGAKISAVIGTAGSSAAGMLCDDGING